MKRKIVFFAFMVLLSMTTLTTTAVALEPIENNERARTSVVVTRIGDLIRRNCPTIHVRWVKFFAEVKSFYDHMYGLGYTYDDAVEAFKQPELKRQFKEAADKYLAAEGVIKEKPETYCLVGEKEIEKKTPVGQLLWSSK